MAKPLKRAAAHRLCKLMGNDRCACEERDVKRPCASLVMFLRAGNGDPDAAFAIFQKQQQTRRDFEEETKPNG